MLVLDSDPIYGQSTPKKAAVSLLAAAEDGDVDGFNTLGCFGVQKCAEKHHHRDAKPYNAAIVDDFAADEALTFVEVDGKWYWFGASTSTGPDPGDFG